MWWLMSPSPCCFKRLSASAHNCCVWRRILAAANRAAPRIGGVGSDGGDQTGGLFPAVTSVLLVPVIARKGVLSNSSAVVAWLPLRKSSG